MKIVCISDTHGAHASLTIPHGDMVIHAGDFTMKGKPSEFESFFTWFAALPHKYKVVVPGNHEVTLCDRVKRNLELMLEARYNFGMKNEIQKSLQNIERVKAIVRRFRGQVEVLIDRAVTMDGIKVWGSPWCVDEYKVMSNWGFFTDDPKSRWGTIPNDVDFLVTHMPPFGVLDGGGFGCKELRDRVAVVKPYLHVFGHIHIDGGKEVVGASTVSINAAVANDIYDVDDRRVVVHTL